VKLGFVLPRKIAATLDAKRPSVLPSASTVNQFLSMFDGFAENVF
jgi:hypothetical protein